ncbi:hypothetical protein E8E13_000735 [Curvularia kusanoi]|uniref:FAD-binding PCMH-type domain-containing protein n=1 Tax=Curvularia kusanoi TaxID=90978 RepID=A0A9P4W647_CURKU|nr:hypothetical protein E8E13_000735 [Curvularia kusanoi]
MKSLVLVAAATCAVVCTAQDSFESPEFNVTQAVLQQGVDISALPTLAGLKERSPWSACAAACNSLKLIPSFEVYAKNTTNYTTFTNEYWATQQGDVNPECIIKPSTPKQVSIAVLISRLTRCPFAVKGGGHAAFAGSSSIEGGITIALEKLNKIEVATDKKSVLVGPGRRWLEFYNELEKHGLAVVGGRVTDVGVPGLTLGGGVTYPDLYWSLRGGGNNFGIVTAFQLHTFPMNKMWGGGKLVANSDFEKALDATYKFGATGAASDEKGSQIISFGYAEGFGPLASAFLTYAEPVTSLPAMFEDWANVSLIQDTTGAHTLSELVSLLSDGVPDRERQTYWDVTFKLDRSLFSFLVNTFYELLPNIIDAKNLLPTISIQLITIPQLQQMQKNGGNAFGISPADGPLFIMNMGTVWTNPADDERILKFNNDIIMRVQAEAAKKGLNNDYIYMNYASGYQAVVSSYGTANQKRLQSTSSWFDPTGVFRKLQPGYFKLDGSAPFGEYS